MEDLVPHVVKKLSDALRRLPLSVSDESVLREQAEFLARAFEISRANNRPTSRRIGTKRSIDELKTLADDFLFLAKSLGDLHIEAREAMVEALGQSTKLEQLQKEILRLQRATCYAIANMAAGKQSAPPVGRHEAKIAMDITGWSASVFESLTGLKVSRRMRSSDIATSSAEAGPYGPFHGFLTDVFAAVDIKASADTMIKKFLMAKTRGQKYPINAI